MSTNRKKELLKNTSIIGIGKISTQFLSFFLLPLYTSILSPDSYGYVDTVNAAVSVLVVLVNIQIEQGLFRFLINCRNDYYEIRRIITSAFFISLSLIIVYTILFSIFACVLHLHFGILLYFNVISIIFMNNIMQISRGLGHNKLYALGGFISSALIITCNILFLVILHMDAKGMLLANIIGFAGCGVYLFIKQKMYNLIRLNAISSNIIKEIITYCIPLIPNELAWKVINSSDRIVVSIILGTTANGILAIAHKFSSAYLMIFYIFNTSWYEFVVMHYNDTDREELLSSTCNGAIKIFGLFALLVISAIPLIFSFFVNKRFYDSYYQIPLFIIADLLDVIVGLFSAIYIAEKATKSIAKTSVGVAFINLTICVCLIKIIGLYAASLSSIFAYGIIALYRYFDTKKYLKIQLNIPMLILLFFSFLFVCISYYLHKFQFATFLSIIVEIILMNRKELRKIIKYMFNIKGGAI